MKGHVSMHLICPSKSPIWVIKWLEGFRNPLAYAPTRSIQSSDTSFETPCSTHKAPKVVLAETTNLYWVVGQDATRKTASPNLRSKILGAIIRSVAAVKAAEGEGGRRRASLWQSPNDPMDDDWCKMGRRCGRVGPKPNPMLRRVPASLSSV